jgi:hypothetical protein
VQASLKLLDGPDGQGLLQASAVGCFLLPVAVKDIKLGPKPVLPLPGAKTLPNGTGSEIAELDNNGQNRTEEDVKDVEGDERVHERLSNPPTEMEQKPKIGAGHANGKVKPHEQHMVTQMPEGSEPLNKADNGGDGEDVDYGNLDVGLEDEVDYDLDEDEAFEGFKQLDTNGVTSRDEEMADIASDPELDMVLGSRMAALIGGESRSKGGNNANSKSVFETREEEGPGAEELGEPSNVPEKGGGFVGGDDSVGLEDSEPGSQGPSAIGEGPARSTQ